jgi:hypothetical protein
MFMAPYFKNNYSPWVVISNGSLDQSIIKQSFIIFKIIVKHTIMGYSPS